MSAAELLLTQAGARSRVAPCLSLDHARSLAAAGTASGETTVAVGGDGLAAALAQVVSEARGVLGLIPAGRGNDLARSLGIPADVRGAVGCLIAGRTRTVDMIEIAADDGPGMLAVGSAYLGLLAEGGEIVNARRRLVRGPFGYELAGLRALATWRPATFTIGGRGPGPAENWEEDRVRAYFVLVASSRYVAAGKMMAPGAEMDDGVLDVVVARQNGPLILIRAMLAAARGRHLRFACMSVRRAASVLVSADRAVLAGADGETLPSAAPLPAGATLRLRALPGALRIISPQGQQGQ